MANTGSLFAGNNEYLPSPFDGETLYSWCSRFHRASGNINPRQTSRLLFGHPSAGLRHDFPGHLDCFQMNTQGFLGQTTELILQRTLFGFHAPFLNDNIAYEVMQAMRSGISSSVRAPLGLSSSGLGVSAPLKACQACLLEDQKTHVTSWWHIHHQWPSILICQQHRQPLLVARDEVHARTLKHWYLPGEMPSTQWQPAPKLTPAQSDRLMKVAQWTEAIISRGNQLDGMLLRHAYLMKAKGHGWIAMDGSLRFHALRDTFFKAHIGLGSLSSLKFLGKVTGLNGGFLGLLLRQYPGARHPIKHLLLMAFLFDAPEEFFSLYQEIKATAETNGLNKLAKQLTTVRAQLQDMVAVDGRSVNSAAIELGITAAQAIRHLRKENIPYQKRPRVLTPAREDELKKLLIAGTERRDIATALSVRRAFIKDYLAGHPDIRIQWEQARLARRTAKYRRNFLRILTENSGVPVRSVKKIAGNGIQWLQKNDREWLEKNLPTLSHN